MMLRDKSFFATLLFCLAVVAGAPAWAAALKDVKVANSVDEATITLNFDGPPDYRFSTLSKPERVVVDARSSSTLRGLPLIFSGQNLVKEIRAGTPTEAGSTRLVVVLTQIVQVQATRQRSGELHQVVLTLKRGETRPAPPPQVSVTPAVQSPSSSGKNPFKETPAVKPAAKPVREVPTPAVATDTRPALDPVKIGRSASRTNGKNERVIVAIDAGHGGQDPGAIGLKGLQEKQVTLAIARKLEALLHQDPNFKPVQTRTGDYFVSVMGRSEVARKQGANVLVSIHADAAPNRNATGASVWVLSNRRANSEMASWLEQHEKQSELLGGAGDLLASTSADPYLSQAVLDLQFGHSQRVGYDIAVKVLGEMQRVGSLHKNRPEHASLGVLRSPDIPSLLVETGFISNSGEEQLLGSVAHQEKVAKAIYQGLRSYFAAHPLQVVPNQENRALTASSSPAGRQPETSAARSAGQKSTAPSAVRNTEKTRVHIVQRGETLTSIARQYGTSLAALRTLNSLKKESVVVGQRLKVPTGKAPIAQTGSSTGNSRPKTVRHQVQRGDTLSAIAARYGVSMSEIQRANKLKSESVQLGQTLVIPQS